MVLFKLTHQLGHPEDYLFSLSRRILPESEYDEHILFYFGNRSTAVYVSVVLAKRGCSPREQPLVKFSKLDKKVLGCIDPLHTIAHDRNT